MLGILQQNLVGDPDCQSSEIGVVDRGLLWTTDAALVGAGHPQEPGMVASRAGTVPPSRIGRPPTGSTSSKTTP